MDYHGKLIKKQELLSLLRGLMVVKIREINTEIIGTEQVVHFEYDDSTDKLKLLYEVDFAVPAGKTVSIVSVESYTKEGGFSQAAFSAADDKETNVNTIYTLEDLFARMV